MKTERELWHRECDAKIAALTEERDAAIAESNQEAEYHMLWKARVQDAEADKAALTVALEQAENDRARADERVNELAAENEAMGRGRTGWPEVIELRRQIAALAAALEWIRDAGVQGVRHGKPVNAESLRDRAQAALDAGAGRDG